MFPLRRPSCSLPLLASLLAFAVLLASCQGSGSTAQPSPTATASPAQPSPTATASPAQPSPTATASPAQPSPTATASPTQASPTATASPAQPSPTATGSPGAAVVSGDEAYRHVLALSQDIGSRVSPSDAEAAAADYIASQLASYGYQPDVQPFDVQYYVEEPPTLTVLSPETIVLQPHALHLSLGGDASGELVAAGLGRPEDFPPKGVAGKVALVERGEIAFSTKIANAAAAGAVAVIVYNNEEGSFRGDLQEVSAIPAVAISQAEGQQLLALLAQGPVTVSLSVKAGQRQGTSRNVIARPPDGQCQSVVGAHYDSVAAGPGANDNASGTAVLLETARVLAADGDREGVCLVAFAAEEEGLLGSRHFVDSLSPEEHQALRGMVNLDMVGVGDEWQLIGSSQLVGAVDRDAGSVGLDPVPAEMPTGETADQNSFIAAGIPAILIYRSNDPRYHSADDQAQFVEPQSLKEATELTLLALRELAQPPGALPSAAG